MNSITRHINTAGLKRLSLMVLMLSAVAFAGIATVYGDAEPVGETQGSGILKDGLVARWTFNDDCYGVQRMVGNPVFADDAPVEGVRSVRFDGSSALILGDSKDLKPEELTVSFWVRRTGSMTGSGWSTLMDASTGNSLYGEGWGIGKWGAYQFFIVLDGEDRIRWDVAGDLNDFLSHNWMHLAIAFDADREIYRIFRNGRRVAEYSDMHGFWTGNWATTGITARQTPVSLGALPNGSQGVPLDFSDIRIYNRVLDDDEIGSLVSAVEFHEARLTAHPQEGGRVKGETEYVKGSQLTVTAELEEFFRFKGWYVDGEKVSDELSYTFVGEQDIELTAHFEEKDTVTISLTPDPENRGSVSGEGRYVKGREITVNAEPHKVLGGDLYRFTGWYEDGQRVSAEAAYRFTAETDRTLDAGFERIDGLAVIRLQTNPAGSGKVIGQGVYRIGEPVSLKAIPQRGYLHYDFENWSVGDRIVADSQTISITARGDIELVANFTQLDVEVDSTFFFATSDTHIGAGPAEEQGTIKTIDIMNSMPGTEFPFGGVVGEPEGLIIAGDLHEANRERERNWRVFAELFDPEGNARFNYPVYEGIGNHDFGTNYIELTSERNDRRPVDLYTCDQNYHYTWEWSGVRIIQLHAFPGKGGPIHEPGNNRDRPWNNPQDSLLFLEDVLENKVVGNQPLILTFHYGLDGWGKSWWSNKERDLFEEVVDGHNVVLVIHGHGHSYKHYTWRGINIMETGDTHTSEGEAGQFAVFRINRETNMLEQAQFREGSWVDQRSFPLVD